MFVVMITLVLMALAPPRSEGQIDAPKILVGKWEGQIQVSRTVSPFPDRTLAIKSVREQEGKWLVEARFGVTGRRLEPVDVTLKVVGEELTLHFRTSAGADVKLSLYKKEYLDGFYLFPGAGAERPIRLKKAE